MAARPAARLLARLWPLAALALVRPAASAAQAPDDGWGVISARLEADLTSEDGRADVTIRYVLRPEVVVGRADRSPLVVELLGFGDATTDRFSRDGDGEMVLWPTVGSHRSAAVRLTDVASDDSVDVTFRYTIDPAVERTDGALRAVIPVLVAPGVPRPGDAGGFEARILLPDGWTPTEGFPAGMRRAPDGAYAGTLAVIPSMVGFRGRSDGKWHPGLPVVIDVLALAILVVFSAVGWRHLQRVASEAR